MDSPNLTKRSRKQSQASDTESEAGAFERQTDDNKKNKSSWQRILLLIVAITIHNIPGKFSSIR